MIVLVTGGRHWSSRAVIYEKLYRVHGLYGIDKVIEGCAPGADSMAEDWCKIFRIPDWHHPAHWRHDDNCQFDCKKMVGRAAGQIRNQEMANRLPHLALAFHDDIQNSSGTKGMINKALAKKIDTYLCDSTGNMERVSSKI